MHLAASTRAQNTSSCNTLESSHMTGTSSVQVEGSEDESEDDDDDDESPECECEYECGYRYGCCTTVVTLSGVDALNVPAWIVQTNDRTAPEIALEI